jgi:hypothetical protein
MTAAATTWPRLINAQIPVVPVNSLRSHRASHTDVFAVKNPGTYLSTIARAAGSSSKVPILVSAVVYVAAAVAMDTACAIPEVVIQSTGRSSARLQVKNIRLVKIETSNGGLVFTLKQGGPKATLLVPSIEKEPSTFYQRDPKA